MSDVTKWACDYCTYQNYPATKKCTLCRMARPPKIIIDNSCEQDIYKVGEQLSSNVSTSSSRLTLSTKGGLDRANKWSCPLCTYLNWPHHNKCVQCDTARLKQSSKGGDPRPRSDFTEPLGINTDDQLAGSSHMATKSQSPGSPDAAEEANNDANNDVNRAARRSPGKWSCRSCTYDNWLQANKCVMCGVQRARPRPTDTTVVCSGGSNMYESEMNRRSSRRRSPPMAARTPEGGATAGVASLSEHASLGKQGELRLKLLRKRLQQNDWLFLGACNGILDGDLHAIEAYLHAGGDPTRQLSSEDVLLLNRSSAFEVGFTLIHLAIRFKREDILALLLTTSDVPNKAIKRLPSHVSPDIVMEIRREISTSLRQRKGEFSCFFFTNCVTFSLPAEIEDLDEEIQKQLFDELLDRDVQSDLESEEPVINWSVEVTERLGSRLYALWNRTAGDCLLDSVLQASWGVLDIDATLRHALSDSLSSASLTFYPRWREFEFLKAQNLHFMLDEAQWQRDWAVLLSLASQPGASLEQTHIFTLAHIFRRPIIVYGVKYVKSFRGETIGFAGFQGVYLPLLWEQSFCWKTPIALGYTRGHFCALVTMEMDTEDTIGARANIESNDDAQIAYLPLIDNESKLLPVHFLSGSEVGREEDVIKRWLDCIETKGGVLVAIQRLNKRPLIVKQMVAEWLEHYRQLAHTHHSLTTAVTSAPTLSSDGESDDE